MSDVLKGALADGDPSATPITGRRPGVVIVGRDGALRVNDVSESETQTADLLFVLIREVRELRRVVCEATNQFFVDELE